MARGDRAAVRHSAESRQVLRRIDEFRQVRTCGNALELIVVTPNGVENIRMEKSSDGLQRYGAADCCWSTAAVATSWSRTAMLCQKHSNNY